MLHASTRRPYGFLDTHSGYFVHRVDNELLVSELGANADLEALDARGRREKRLQHEEGKWDPEYYMQVFNGTSEIDSGADLPWVVQD